VNESELRVLEGPAAGRTIAIRAGVVLGRGEGIELTIADDEMSRRHARVVADASGAIVEDLGSLNGTFVNGERIGSPRRLVSGDRIKVGTSILRFVAAPAPARAQEIASPDVTRAHDIVAPDDATRARDVPIASPDVTRAREIVAPADVTAARDVPIAGADVSQTRIRDVVAPPGVPPAGPTPPGVPPPEAPQTAAGQLRVVKGATTSHVVPVVDGLALGRDPACDIVFNDEEISRRHAQIAVGGGQVTLEDQNSTNGTFLDGERVLGSHRLEDGDRIELGSAVLDYEAPALQTTRVRRVQNAAPQVTSVRQIVEQPAKLLTAETGSRKWWTLAVVCVATFMLLVDTTIVSVALPSISKALNASFADLQWVIDAYSALLAAMLLTAGSLSDRFGRRLVFLIGLVVFTASSALCGLAPSSVALDIFRGVQGFGAAMMLGPAAALVAQEFPPRERGVAFAVVGGVTGLGIAVGPLVGGILTDGFSWEAIFYVNVPIGLGAIFLTLRYLVNIPGAKTKIDYGGSVTFSLATFLIVFALIRGNESGWGSAEIVGAIAAGLILLVAFVFIERSVESPIMDLKMFRIPTFNGVSAASFALSASILALIIYITLWFQSVLGFSPLGAGLRLLAITGMTLIFAPIGGRLSGLISPRLMLGMGLGFMSAGAFIMTRINADSEWTVLLPGLVLAGLGLGVSAPALANTAVSIVPPWRSGMASGLNYTWRQLGLATGIAVLGSVFAHEISVNVVHLLVGAPGNVSPTATSKAISAGATPQIVSHVPATVGVILHRTAAVSFADALQHIFLISGIVAGLGAIAGFTLVRDKDMVSAGHGGPPPGKGPGGPPPGVGAPEGAAVPAGVAAGVAGGPPAGVAGGPPGGVAGGPPGGGPPGFGGPPGGPPPGVGAPPGGPPGVGAPVGHGGPPANGAGGDGDQPQRGLTPKVIGMLLFTAAVGAAAIAFMLFARTTPKPCATEFNTGVGNAGQALHLISGPDGNLYATESANSKILRFNPVTHQKKLIDLPPGTIPHDVESFPDGNIWFDALNDRIGKLNVKTDAITMYPGIPKGSQPHTMVWDRGYIYFAALKAGKLGRLNPKTGQITEGTYGLPPGNQMHSLVVVPGGYIWGSLSNGNKLARFNPSLGRFDKLVEMPIRNSGPRDIAYLPAYHSLYLTVFAANKLARYNLDTGKITLFNTPLQPVSLASANALSHVSKLTFIRADANKRYVWAATFGPDLLRLDPATGNIKQVTCGINLPGLTSGLANDAHGNLWFNEVLPGRIAEMHP
jgi:EmrB/QacA subfamily drug resistance transporter